MLLFKLKSLMHNAATTDVSDIDSVTRWEPPPGILCCIKLHPTLFLATYFIATEQYPDGVADMVGTDHRLIAVETFANSPLQFTKFSLILH